MNRTLLEAAAKHLETLDNKVLEMGAWMTLHEIFEEPQIDLDRLVIHPTDVRRNDSTCGYAGCAIGECSYLSEFQAVGITPEYLTDSANIFSQWRFVAARLGLDENQMMWLFHIARYQEEREEMDWVPAAKVAERIRQLLADEDAVPDDQDEPVFEDDINEEGEG